MGGGNDLQSGPLAWLDKSLSGFFFQFCGFFYNLSPRCICSAVACQALSSRSAVALCPRGVPKNQDPHTEVCQVTAIHLISE